MEILFKRQLTKDLSGAPKITSNSKKFKNKQKRYSKN